MKKNLPEVNFQESSKDHKITFLFCPISSRIGADVMAAMSEVKGEEYYYALSRFFNTNSLYHQWIFL